MKIDLNEAVRCLVENDNIVILPHDHPDGDTLGSAFALKRALDKIGKKVKIVCDDVIPEKYSYMIQDVKNDDFSDEKFVVAVDVADISLLGEKTREKYKNKIQVYLGIEEDAFSPQNRGDFDYIIGSNHYFRILGNYYDVDLSLRQFNNVLKSFGGDILELARNYYEPFCDYIKSRKPDIIGHFDLITKFDEPDCTFLNNEEYKALAEKYLLEALKADCFFEVNTGAISRGYRTSPYPSIDLLHTLKKNGGKLVLNSDSHSADTLDCFFEESKKLLKDIGFEYTYTLYNNEFIKDYL